MERSARNSASSEVWRILTMAFILFFGWGVADCKDILDEADTLRKFYFKKLFGPTEARQHLCIGWRGVENIFIILKNSVDERPPLAIVIYAMSNPNMKPTVASITAQPFVRSLEKMSDGTWLCVLKQGYLTDNGLGQGVMYEANLRDVVSFLKTVAPDRG